MYSRKICDKKYKSSFSLGGHVGSHNRFSREDREKFKIMSICLGCNSSIEDDSRKKNKRKFCRKECRTAYSIRKINESIVFNIKRSDLENYHMLVNKCEICGNIEKANTYARVKNKANRLSKDHNHETGNFRGLLCYSCNVKLGWYEKLSKEINKYLENNNNFEFVKKKMGL